MVDIRTPNTPGNPSKTGVSKSSARYDAAKAEEKPQAQLELPFAQVAKMEFPITPIGQDEPPLNPLRHPTGVAWDAGHYDQNTIKTAEKLPPAGGGKGTLKFR